MNVHRTSVYLLIVSVIALIALGLVMMSSTSAYAPESHGDATFLLKKQAGWLALGVGVFAIAAAVDYHMLQKAWWILLAVSVVLLALCYVPRFCHLINGSRRWIQLGALRFPALGVCEAGGRSRRGLAAARGMRRIPANSCAALWRRSARPAS